MNNNSKQESKPVSKRGQKQSAWKAIFTALFGWKLQSISAAPLATPSNDVSVYLII